MKKPFLLSGLLCLSLFSGSLLFGQTASLCRDVVASGGGDAALGNKKFEYTLGESVIHTIGNGGQRLSQGFHQPEICPLTVVGVSEITEASGLRVFPNPTTGELKLHFAAPSGQAFDLQVFNTAGQQMLLLPKLDDTAPRTVDCRTLPSGIYFLLALKADGSAFFQVPFVKAER